MIRAARSPLVSILGLWLACTPFDGATDGSTAGDGGGGPPTEASGDLSLGDGRDGAYTAARDVVVNRYYAVAEIVPAGADRIPVAPPLDDKVGPGDVVLLWQMLGVAPPRKSGDGSLVALDDDDGAGRYELARVVEIEEGAVVLDRKTTRAFEVPSQLVRVPQFQSLTIPADGSIVATPFDGKTGGIVAVLAQGSVALDGVVRASGAGSKGGVAQNAGTHTNCTGLDGALASGFARKGEGLQGRSPSEGRGNWANGGGGGACHNAGGGGGGHAGAGGSGGDSWVGQTSGRQPVGGNGGASVSFPAGTRLVMGGGGGAGENNDGTLSGGGNGGGVVWIRASRIAGTGTIQADGLGAPSGDGSGAGGGGAGGLVDVQASEAIVCGRMSARGAKGGNITSALGRAGPGGGGGGGVIRTSARGACEVEVAGGESGAFSNGDRWGATSGAAGRID